MDRLVIYFLFISLGSEARYQMIELIPKQKISEDLGSHMYICNKIWLFSLVNLSHADLIIRSARTLRVKFLPPHTLSMSFSGFKLYVLSLS